MSRLLPLFALLVVLAAGCRSSTPAADEALAERLMGNLRAEFPALDGMDARIDSLRPSGVDGVMEGHLVLPGQPPQPFLYAAPTERLYLLAAPAVSVGRSDAELAVARTRRDSLEAAEAQAAANRLEAIAASLPARGRRDAPITMVEFSDFQCGYCARAAATVAEVLATNPDVRLVYAHFPLDGHAWARPAAMASTCAGQQNEGAFWRLHDVYFREQRAFTPENVIARSRAALAGTGVDLAAWNACVTDTASEAHRRAAAGVDAQESLGASLGVTGTPAFFVNGRMISGAQPREAFEAVFASARAERR